MAPPGMNPPPEVLQVLYEDQTLLAVVKPAGLHVFPSRRGERRSLWSLLRNIRPELEGIGGREGPAIVHRLDRDTSGLLLAARSDRVFAALRDAFRAGRVRKDYLALIEGELTGALEVDLPLGARHRRSRTVAVQLPGRRLRGARPARTAFTPLVQASGMTLCRVSMTTGVRHQIRAHLAYLGHPIVGDRAYGSRRELVSLKQRHFLHAWGLALEHPDNGVPLRLVCPPAEDLRTTLEDLGLEAPPDPHFSPEIYPLEKKVRPS